MGISKLIRFLCWVSPLFALIRDTRDAVTDGYSEHLLTDPGHTRIHKYDKVVVFIAWIVVAALVFTSMNYYEPLFDDSELALWATILFPYMANIYVGLILYINSGLLAVYNSQRKRIIRNINEKAGVW